MSRQILPALHSKALTSGERLIHSLEYFLNLGCAGVMAIDSDTPTLPTHCLQQAIALLTRPDVDVVLGPSDDGGYYLIGIRAMHRDLFVDMPWSTSAVLPETVRRAEVLGLRVAWLPAWFDVDTPEDLARYVQRCLRQPARTTAHTTIFLERT